MKFDYKRLLIVYMRMIGRVGSIPIECPFDTKLDALSEEEIKELNRLEEEARETYPQM